MAETLGFSVPHPQQSSPLSITCPGFLTTCGGKCPVIYGVVTDLTNATVSSLSGFYCPGSGRIVFMRKDNTTGRVFQVYRGNASQTAAGQPLLIGGTLIDYGQNRTIQFPFAAQK
jgi:hypothetical protein